MRIVCLSLIVALYTAAWAVACNKCKCALFLKDAGLCGMQDVDGDSVRGQGFASAWGSSYATVRGHKGSAASSNGYKAISNTRRAQAGGANGSFATSGYKTFEAGGFSEAYAK